MRGIENYKTLYEARVAHEEDGGILLVLDNGEYQVCSFCVPGGCGHCPRSEEWIDSLGPSWSEASHENMSRDPRNKIAVMGGLKIAQPDLF